MSASPPEPDAEERASRRHEEGRVLVLSALVVGFLVLPVSTPHRPHAPEPRADHPAGQCGRKGRSYDAHDVASFDRTDEGIRVNTTPLPATHATPPRIPAGHEPRAG
jgi:hypothetical protein